MLEDKLAELLQSYLGKYIVGVSKDSLRVSVWNGDIELKNAEIKRDALDELGLPLTIAAGYVGSVKIQIPWSRLGRVPILVLVDEVILCLRPVDRQDVVAAKQAASQAIRRNIETKERQYLEVQSKGASGKDRETWISALANTIVRSLKFNITNVHVRYEDQEQLGRSPAAPCSAGVMLSKLAAVTVGDRDTPPSGKSNASAKVSNLVEMQQLALYFIPQSSVKLVEQGDWDAALESRARVLKQRSRAVQELLEEKDFYLVKPVSAWARYRRHERGEVHLAAYQDIQITVDRVSFRLAQEQYRSILLFVESARQWSTLLQHVALRPQGPVVGNASLWWRYAILAVLVRLGRLKSGASWHELMKRARLRRQYVASYAMHLRAPEKRPHEEEDLAVIQQGVSADAIAEWRVLGRQLLESAFVEKATAWKHEGPALTLSKEDWERCNELIGYREGMENPFHPDLDFSSIAHTVVGVTMDTCGLGLAKGTEELMGLSCPQTVARVALFSHKTEVRVGLASCVVHASGKPVLETGVETVEEAATVSFESSNNSGEANPWSLVAALQPAYILVEKENIDMLVSFFESTNQLAPTATQEAAAVFQRTLEDVARAAKAGLGDSVALHGRFKLDLDFDAPKICIPSASRRRSSRSHLLLDMGRLKLYTEAGLEALTTTLSDVSVRVEKGGSSASAHPNLKGFFLGREDRTSSGSIQSSSSVAPPVIEECSVVVQLTEKKTVRQKGEGGPSFQAQITIPSLAFNYSPAVHRELLTVLSPFLDQGTPSAPPAELASSRAGTSRGSRASLSSVGLPQRTPRGSRLDSSVPAQPQSTRSSEHGVPGAVKLAVVGDLGRLSIKLFARALGPAPSLGGELPLLFLKAKGTQLNVALLHSGDVHASASMSSLVVEDALASRESRGIQYLIQSTAILHPPASGEMGGAAPGPLPRATSSFYDAEDELLPASESSGESPRLEPAETVFHDAPATLGALPSPDHPAARQEQQGPGERFFHAELVLWSQQSRAPGRPNVQVQLKSGGLTFHFNRPTIVSLIACVTELTTLPRRASTALGAPPTTPGRQQSGVPALEEAQAEEGHVTFALLLDMEETQLFLNVENSPVPLALCLQERLHVSVKVQGGGGLEVEADIGNFKVLDPGLGRTHPHGWILTPACRSRGAPQSSFVSLRYASPGSGVLEGGYPSSVKVTVGEVRVVYFHRFVLEVVSYFTGLVPPREQGTDQGTEQQLDWGADTLAAIQLEGTMADSQIVLPESSQSLKALVFAMEKLAFRNQLEESGPEEETPGTCVDTILVTVESLHLHSVVGSVGGVEGADMIHDVQGLDLQVRRPLKDPDGVLPHIAWVSLKVANMVAGMSVQDFECLQQCALGNFSEQPREFGTVFGEGALVAADRTPSAGRTGASTTMQFNVEAANLCLSLFPGQHHDNSFASIQVEGFWLQHAMLSDGGARLLLSAQRGFLRECSEAPEEARPVLWMAGDTDPGDARSPSKGVPSQSHLLQQLRNVFLPDTQPSVQCFISAEYASSSGDQLLSLTLQVPCILLDLPFFKKLVEFFAPPENASASAQTKPGLAGWRKAVRLHSPVVHQDLDSLSLTPLRPMVADAPGIDDFTYDGNGRALHLSPSPSAHAPLVYVGQGKRLRIKNVVIHGAPAQLQRVLHLAPNSSFSASPEDGVTFLPPGNPGNFPPGGSLETRQQQIPAPATRPAGTFRLAVQASAVELLAVDEPEWAQDVVVRPETTLRLQFSGTACMTVSGGLTETSIQVASLQVTTGSGLPFLEPVDATSLITVDGARTKARVSLSHVAGNLSLNTLGLLLRLQQQALSLFALPDENAIAQCDLFNRILVYTDDKQKLSFWRPRAPPGFAPLGDCLTTDGLPPSRAVLTVNMQSTLASRPTAYRLLYRVTAQGCKEKCFSVWEPVPREGFAALGCVIQEGAGRPALGTAFCVARAVVCSTVPRDCITAHGRVDGLEMPDGLAFWRMANRGSTIVACEGGRAPPMAQALEVLDKLEAFAEDGSPGQGQYGRDNFQQGDGPHAEDDALLLSPNRQHSFVEADAFDCVWASSASADHPISIWRPRCEASAAMLGDIAMEGLEPPASAYVVRDTGDGLLAAPERWHLWSMPGWQARPPGVSFWFPLGPPGYCGLGVVAQKGPQEPPLNVVRCVRNDALVACGYHPASVPLPTTDRESAESATPAVYRVDNKARTFFPSTQSPPRRLAQGIFQLDEPNAQYSFQLSLEVPAVSVTVYDDFGGLMAPVADLRFADVRLDCLQRPEALKTQIAFALNVKTHQPLNSQWEPFLERWNGMATYYTREAAQGTLTDLRLASNTALNVDIAPVGLNQLLECYASWQRLCSAQEMAQRRFHLSEAFLQGRLDGSTSAREQSWVVVVNKSGLDLVARFPEGRGGEEPTVLLVPPASLTSLVLPPSAGLQKLHTRPAAAGQRLELLALTILKITLPMARHVLGKSCCCTVAPREEAGAPVYYAHTKAASLKRAKPSHLECCWNECFVFPTSPGRDLEISLTDAQTGRGLARLSWLAPPFDDEGSSSLNGGMKGSWYIMHQVEGGSLAHLLVEWAWLRGSGQAPGARSKREGLPPSGASDLEIACSEQGPFVRVSSGYATGAVPWKLPRATLAREISFQDGVKHIVVRSLVVMHNECPLPVEVALCPAALLGHDNGLECASQSEYLHGTKSTDPGGQEVVVGAVEVEEMFENQRCAPLAGWSSAYLLPSDPKAWSNRNNTVSSRVFREPPLPRGWVWASDWHLEVNAAVDKDGWAYYPNFRDHSWPPSRPEQRSKGMLDWVRRRRHVRYRHFLPENVLEERVSLGVVAPGESMPVPARFLSQTFDDLVVQVRPAPPGGARFLWGDPEGPGAAAGQHVERDSEEEWARLNTFRVRALRETEVTVRCPSASGPGAAWILMSAEATSLPSGGLEREGFQDWRVLLKPPLVVRNALPLPADLQLGALVEEAERMHGAGGFSRTLAAGAHWDVMVVGPGAHVPMSLSVGGVWEMDPMQKGQLVSLSHKDSFPPSLVLTHRHSQRRVEVQVTCLSNTEQEAVRVLLFSVPTYLDMRGCPPLALSFDSPPEKEKHGRLNIHALKNLKLPGQPRVSPETRAGAICAEEPSTGPWLLPSLELHSTLRLALEDAEPQGLLNWAALCEGGNQQVTAQGADGRFIDLVAFLDVDSQGIAEAPSRVIRLRPLYGFTNRLGRPVRVRFPRTIGSPQVHELGAHAYQASLLLPVGSRSAIVQAAVEGCEWSLPVVLQREGRSPILLRPADGGDPVAVVVDVRPGGGNCGFSVILQPGWQGLPFLLENRSLESSVFFRQVHGHLWQQLPPMSCKAYAWEDPAGEQRLQLTRGTPEQARESRGSGTSRAPAVPCQSYAFTAGPQPPLRASEAQGSTRDLEVSVTDVGPHCQHLLIRDMPDPAWDGLPLGLGIPTEPGAQGAGASVADKEAEKVRPTSSVRASRQQELRVAVDLLSVGFSIIDSRPQELLYMFVEDVVVDYVHSSGTKDNSVRIGVKRIQVDNQLPLSPLPVLFALERLPESSPQSILLEFQWKQKGSAGGDEVYQYACVKMCEETWAVNIHEAVIWRLWDFCSSIHTDRLSVNAQEAAFQADPYIQIGKYETTGVLLKLTLEPAPSARPRGILGSWGALVTAAGNAKRMPIRFRSYTLASRRVRKSAIPSALVLHVIQVLRSQVLQILSGVDVLGVVSSIFASLGRGTSSLSVLKQTGTQRLHFQEALGNRPAGIGEGLLYGAETVAQSVARGARGVFERSKSGLDQAGPVGLVSGLGRGVAGLFLHPLAGMLSCVALCVDGLDASLTSWSALVVPRPPLHPVRYPRAIQGDRILREYHEPSAIGQLVLYKAEMGSYFGKRDIFRDHAKFVFSDFYQQHFQMRRGRVLLLTSRRVMMVQTPLGSGKQDGAAVLSSKPGVVRWEVPWENLLFAEVGSYPRDTGPAILVHVRYSAGRLFHRARCPPPADAPRILQAILQTAQQFGAAQQGATKEAEAGDDLQSRSLRMRSSRRRPGISPSATNAQLVSLGEQGLAVAHQPGPSLASSRSSIFSLRSFRRPRGDPASAQGLELEPLETTVFVRVVAALQGAAACHPQAAAKQLSIWRPLPPEGCVFLGDVLCLQEEPPTSSTVYMDKGPECFAAPTGFKLVWRSEDKSLGQAVSIWEPIAPEGFVTVGHVALPDFCSPAADPSLPLRCPRRDLVEAALVTPDPVWHLPATRKFPWPCSIHAVANRLWSFLAYRSPGEAAHAAGWKVCTEET